MDQEITSALNRALFHQETSAHIRIMNIKRNAMGAITVLTHPNATAGLALQHRDIIITEAMTVDKGVMDVEDNESWARLMIHAVPFIRYMGKGKEGVHKTGEEFEAQDEGIVIPTKVNSLPNPRTIRERRQNGDIAASLVVFIVMGWKVAQSGVQIDINAAGVWYQVETHTNAGLDSTCERSCRWGHNENKCGSKHKCGHCSGHHRPNDHQCNLVGCTAKQGSLCGPRLEK